MSKLIHHTHLKPQNYYNRLFVFFALIAVSLTMSLIRFDLTHLDIFLLKFIVIYFLLLTMAATIEFWYKSDYMSPLETYDVELFYREFVEDLKSNGVKDRFNKYDYRSKKILDSLQEDHSRFILSSIKKQKKTYEITFIDEKKMAGFIIAKFLIKGPIHKMYVVKHESGYKVHRLI